MKDDEIKVLLDKPNKTDEEVSSLKEILCNKNQEFESKEWCDKILTFSKYLVKSKSSTSVVAFLKDAYEAYTNNHNRRFSQKLRLLYELSKQCFECGDEVSLKTYVKEYLYNALSEVEVNNVNTKMGFYSFRSFSEFSLDDIKNETISVAHPRFFNDPLDTLLEWWLSYHINVTKDDFLKEFSILLRKASEHIKLRCLIGDKVKDVTRNIEDLPILMWSHYANSHKGFCVRYEFTEDMFVEFEPTNKGVLKFIHPVNYCDINMSLSKVPTMKEGIFTKSQVWEYENEVRLLYLNLEKGEDDKDFPTLGCKKAIKEVYLGVKCSDYDRQRMEAALRNLDVKLYRMQIDENNPTKLKKLRIG